MRRGVQQLLWIPLGALVGVVQAIGTQVRVGLNLEFFSTVPLLFGMGWLSTAFLLSDFIFLRRSLMPMELLHFLAVVTACALVLGFILWGWGLMVGFPLTAAAIFCADIAFRKTSSKKDTQEA